MELKEFALKVGDRINAFMKNYIEGFDDAALQLKESMKYGLLLGGKRARPLLVYATGLSLGSTFEKLDYPAAAIECIHAYSLIHDDMPEMDNDKLRRGHETVHVKFSQTVALLAGDALQTMAFEILSDEKSGLSTNSVAKLVKILATKAGYTGMCGGQAMDLDSEGKKIPLETLRLLHSKKTGALIRAAVLMGAIASENVTDSQLCVLDEYAKYTGLAFQIWDDILDVIGDTKVMGKTQGSDISLDKSTYVSLLGLENAKKLAHECVDNAISELNKLDIDTSILAQFARFTISRDH